MTDLSWEALARRTARRVSETADRRERTRHYGATRSRLLARDDEGSGADEHACVTDGRVSRARRTSGLPSAVCEPGNAADCSDDRSGEEQRTSRHCGERAAYLLTAPVVVRAHALPETGSGLPHAIPCA